jgi:type IV pilus assembly protein PilO
MARLPFLDTLASAPKWQRLVFGLVVLIAFAGAGYVIAILPVENRVLALRAQRETQQREIGRLQAASAELARVRRQAAEVERELELVKEKLPTQREIPALYRTLSDAAVQAGLAVALFQPQTPRVKDFYSEIPIAVVAEGRYHELGDFVGRVAGLPRATMVGELKLTAPNTEAARAALAASARGRSRADAGTPKRSLRAEMTLVTYVYRPVGSPPPPKPTGTAVKSEAARP